ncbi:MAG: hypothetical protein AABW89_02825 [Nanoarchaeota archaeon]
MESRSEIVRKDKNYTVRSISYFEDLLLMTPAQREGRYGMGFECV